jgi:hypothetical protein
MVLAEDYDALRKQYTWTNEKPTVEGWYWYLEVSSRNMTLLYMVQVIDCDGKMIAYLGGEDNSRLVSKMNGNWAGPLVSPEGR